MPVKRTGKSGIKVIIKDSQLVTGSVVRTADHVVVISEVGEDKDAILYHGDGCPINQCPFQEDLYLEDEIRELDVGVHLIQASYHVGGWAGTEPVEHDMTFLSSHLAFIADEKGGTTCGL